jgi:hypothetical protein
LPAEDAAVPKLIASNCAVATMVEGPPRCRMAQEIGVDGTDKPATPHCCYAAQIFSACAARPFPVGGRLRRARLTARRDWLDDGGNHASLHGEKPPQPVVIRL